MNVPNANGGPNAAGGAPNAAGAPNGCAVPARCYVVEIHTAGEESVLMAVAPGGLALRTFATLQQAVEEAYSAVDVEVRRLRGIHARLSVYYERPNNQGGPVARILNDGVLIKRFSVYTWGLAQPAA